MRCLSLSGLWLSVSGRPLNSLIFTAHKLLGLGTAILLVVMIYHTHQQSGLSTPQLAFSALTGVLFLSTVIAGSFLSFERPTPAIVLWLHQVVPALTAVSAFSTVYLLLDRTA